MLRKCLDGDNNYAELVSPYSNKNTWKTPCRCSIINEFSRKSSQSDMENDRKLFCHNDFFNYMNSRKTLTIKSIGMKGRNNNNNGKSNTFTSITTLNFKENSLILILSTLNARVLMLKYDLENNAALKYDEVNLLKALPTAVNSQTPLLSSALNINLAVLDTSANRLSEDTPLKRDLFVTFDRYLYAINLQNCEQFTDCESCLGIKENQAASNPFCGWCVYEQKCMLKETCNKRTKIGKIDIAFFLVTEIFNFS